MLNLDLYTGMQTKLPLFLKDLWQIVFIFRERSPIRMAVSRLCLDNLLTYETSDLPEVDQVNFKTFFMSLGTARITEFSITKHIWSEFLLGTYHLSTLQANFYL